MRLLEFDKTVSLSSVIGAIKTVPEKDIAIKLAEGTPWTENPVNKKILRKAAQGLGKTIHFDGDDELPAEAPATPVSPNSEPSVAEEKSLDDDSGFVVGEDVAAVSASPIAGPELTTAAISPQAEPEKE